MGNYDSFTLAVLAGGVLVVVGFLLMIVLDKKMPAESGSAGTVTGTASEPAVIASAMKAPTAAPSSKNRRKRRA